MLEITQQTQTVQDTYNFSTKIRDKEVKYRKWKVKDKKKYTKALMEKNAIDIADALVYDCIEDKNLPLTTNEYRYMLMKIRCETVGSFATFKFNCNNCNEEFEIEEDINNVLIPHYKDYGTLKTDNVTLKMGPIKNKQTFNEYLIDAKTPREIYLIEFLIQIEEINGEDVFTIEYLNDFIDIVNFQSNIFPYYMKARIFALTSKWEGFGNVIVEALSAGTTVVCTNCTGGPKMILENGKYGHLIELNDKYTFSNILLNELNNSIKKDDKLINYSEKFTVQKVAKLYLELMTN